ncbi:lipopolysaccharide biosynthesis protein [Cupriavidus sp. UME77]|uniref:lipopolysaccharide biosynthesis protein n=1 Tax=Cupriavidus sp. UME77 TaxID=1862321 RepID=UPI0016043190|nr:oligosaccharide flippase family protein [Cupriavidus sp. UME77]
MLKRIGAVRQIMQKVRRKFEAPFRKGFVKSVGVLVGGAAFSQALMVLVLPLLTRLYAPADFSVLAVYASILGVVSVAACLRLEIAIPLPLRDDDAANLLALALCCSAGVAGVSALLVALLPEQFANLLAKGGGLRPYLWLLPLGIWLSSSYTALQFWSTRKKRFSVIAKTRMTQGIGGASTQVALGFAGMAPLGLVLGQMINSGAGIFGLVRDALSDRTALSSISRSRMRSVFFEYSRFPKYSTLESLANSAGIQIPIIIISAYAVGAEAGFLLLASRVMLSPMTLIGGAVSQVYLSHAPEELRIGNLGRFTARTMGGLLKTGVGPLIFAGIMAPVMFPLIFGPQWRRAGEMLYWMTPWFVMQFLASPVSMTLHVTQSQRAALVLQVLGLVLRVGAVSAAVCLAQLWIFESYAITSFIFYLFYLWVVILTAQIRVEDLLVELRSGAIVVAGWTLLAILMRMVVWGVM